MHAFFVGLMLGVIGLVSSFLFEDPSLIETVLLYVGVGSLLLAALFSGALASGDRGRANYSDEQDFKQRMGWSGKLFLFGAPCALASLAIYLLR